MADPRSAAVVADRLHSLSIRLLRRLRREDAEGGLTAPQLSALSVVVFAGPLSLGELARAEQVSAPTMSRLVGQLEASGLVVRAGDSADRRVTRLSATTRGERVLTEGRARRVMALARELENLPSGELEALERAAQVLQRVLEPPRS